MTKVSVIGSISMDLVTRTNRVPNAGETVFGEDFAMVPGGKGANQAVAFARLSPNEVSMIGAVGKDAFGESNLSNSCCLWYRSHIFKKNCIFFEV
ncbi:PfkB family carbohydrate kinase, partial [Lactococcus lactis]